MLIAHHNIVKNTQTVTTLVINQLIFEPIQKRTRQGRHQKSLARLICPQTSSFVFSSFVEIANLKILTRAWDTRGKNEGGVGVARSQNINICGKTVKRFKLPTWLKSTNQITPFPVQHYLRIGVGTLPN